MSQYRVTGPYVTVKTRAATVLVPGRGAVVAGYPRGAILPADVEQAQLDHLVSQGLVELAGDDTPGK